MRQRHVPARHLNASGDKKSMSRIVLVSAVLICGSLFVGCSRKQAQTAAPVPEVLVTTVKPQDVPRVLERVATLDGFINANINAQVQGYIVSRDYTGRQRGKKGRPSFSHRSAAVPSRAWRKPMALWQKTKPTR